MRYKKRYKKTEPYYYALGKSLDQKESEQSETRKWLTNEFFSEWKPGSGKYIAVTMHLRFLSETESSKAITHFLNRLNRLIFKSQHRHKGPETRRKLECIAVREGTTRRDLHYHLLLENPWGFGLPIIKAIRDTWKKMHHIGYNYKKPPYVEFGADPGWLLYITKLRSKTDFLESFDWANTHRSAWGEDRTVVCLTFDDLKKKRQPQALNKKDNSPLVSISGVRTDSCELSGASDKLSAIPCAADGLPRATLPRDRRPSQSQPHSADAPPEERLGLSGLRKRKIPPHPQSLDDEAKSDLANTPEH